MKFEVTILGSSSATPVFNRNQTAQVLNCNEKLYLIDCGEGTQQQLMRYGIKASKIDHIFISHLHGDHFFGLVGLLSTLHLNRRIKPLTIFAPPEIKEILDIQFLHSDTRLCYEIIYHSIDAKNPAVIFSNNDLSVETIVLHHRIPCTGFKFTEKKRLRKLVIDQLERDDVPVTYYPLLKRGINVDLPDGREINYVDYSMESAVPKIYCYCSDTRYDESYFYQIADADTLYHEATFLHEMLERAFETHHTTALQAAEIAVKVGAKKLLIGHFSSRYKTLEALLAEAKSVFQHTELATEGRTFQI